MPKVPLPVTPLESVAVAVMENLPAVPGVPLMPPESERVRPSGRPDPEKV